MKDHIEELNDQKFIHVITTGRKTGKSHTVELWFAYDSGKIYLSHEGDHTDWMKNISKNERVGVIIGSSNFDAVGRLIKEEGSSREAGKKSLYEKYYHPATKEVIDDWFELSTIVELTPVDKKM